MSVREKFSWDDQEKLIAAAADMWGEMGNYKEKVALLTSEQQQLCQKAWELLHPDHVILMRGTELRLLRDITAEELAMDSYEPGGGYRPGEVIGPKGTTVRVVNDNGDDWLEVDGFANDRTAVGFVPRVAVEVVE